MKILDFSIGSAWHSTKQNSGEGLEFLALFPFSCDGCCGLSYLRGLGQQFDLRLVIWALPGVPDRLAETGTTVRKQSQVSPGAGDVSKPAAGFVSFAAARCDAAPSFFWQCNP